MTTGRPARAAGALVVLGGGEPLAWVDRRAHHLVTFAATPTDRRWADALASLVKDGRMRSLEVRKIDGQTGSTGPIADVLRSAGFVDGYRGLVLRL